jgi:hypothetical protein
LSKDEKNEKGRKIRAQKALILLGKCAHGVDFLAKICHNIVAL